MAQRRRSTRTPTRAPRRTQRRAGFRLGISPQTTRALVGVVLLVLGAVTLIALLLPGSGILNRYVNDILRPAFGQGAWLLPVVLIVAGFLVERAPSMASGGAVTALGGLLCFLGGLGLIQLVWGHGSSSKAAADAGGWVGQAMVGPLTSLVGPAGTFVVLVGVIVAGLLLLLNSTIRGLLHPVAAGGRALAGVMSAPDSSDRPDREPAPAPRDGNGRRGAGGAARPQEEPELPLPMPSPAPISQTVWAGSRGASGRAAGQVSGAVATGGPGALGAAGAAVLGIDEALAGEPPRRAVSATGPDGLLEAIDAPQPLHERPWSLPGTALLDPPRDGTDDDRLDHERNVRIIEEKLRSFQIPASVSGINEGPVVTQYEVRPDARIKLSRIESLADDLAMALAARSIRIEAPIPGKDVVGIEVPNHASEIVGFRQLVDDADMLSATGKLTFALGRDVSGKAYAVDLAKMPHLLIAGATGSGKSVCVNALITSLLMRATPAEVRLVLVDLKRVELAAYDGLPHLLTNVIVEAQEAKSALHWAVSQMEYRYKRLAEKAERNIAAYNVSPRVSPEERLPYIVIVIDELADLIMREGRKVEDPVVKIAQKARAVGIHLVLATQRPSVNVVTGLIKANVPSRIAFAMVSNVDSRTVLDQPGAEDLIGRGDMLYQPADLPRPVRLQGVFVSDAEVRRVTDHWREQAPEPEYDPEIVAYAEGEASGGGQFGWLAQVSDDEMTPRAADLVVTTGKASTSMLQTKLKVGFNRASRLMDDLERFGIVGPQDPRNPAVPRHVYGPENWLRGPDDADDPGY
ncbi:MAG: DNA translocase FtsK 4TM domain-containing protein [Candidatus Limnocylindrales bacterium]